MLRALVISLLIVVMVATTVPYGESLAEGARRVVAGQPAGRYSSRRSRAWWRHRRVRLRRQRALAAARRRRRWAIRRAAASAGPDSRAIAGLLRPFVPVALPSVSPSSVASLPVIEAELRAPLQLAVQAAPSLPFAYSVKLSVVPRPALPAMYVPSAREIIATALPAPSPLAHAAFTPAAPLQAALAAPSVRAQSRFTGLPVPHSWQNVSSTLSGEFKFSLRAADGRAGGTALWSRVNLAASASSDRRNRALAGVPQSSLRRTVIDRMLQEGGWVVNDLEREVAGQRVYVVFAQSAGGGVRRAWTYYFLELGGQIYSLATIVPDDYADATASEAEQTLAALASRFAPAADGRR